jgi:hypothetical protein
MDGLEKTSKTAAKTADDQASVRTACNFTTWWSPERATSARRGPTKRRGQSGRARFGFWQDAKVA